MSGVPPPSPKPARPGWPDRHVLYEASVQSVEHHLMFVDERFRKTFRRRPSRLREDFCGTARLACEWATWGEDHQAWGVDLDRSTLEWGRRHHLSRIGEASSRVELIEGNVLNARTPKVDVTVAFNFSYWVFHRREELLRYFRAAYRSLDREGLFVCDIFGGSGAGVLDHEPRRVSGARDAEGRRIPAFTYIWEQDDFNPITHRLRCHIHYLLRGGREIKRAFTYDWRMWTLPELREIAGEAGFSRLEIYTHGWEAGGTSNEVYARRERFENTQAWLAFAVAVKTPG